MFSNELEFVAEEWARLAADRAESLGLPNSLLAREFLVRGMCMLTGRQPGEIRGTITEEMLKAHIFSVS